MSAPVEAPPEVALPPGVDVLAPFVAAGVFAPAEVHLCAAVARLAPTTGDEVLLALALAARGPRLGHVCVDLGAVATGLVDQGEEAVVDLPWPEPAAWVAALDADDAVVADPARADEEPLRPLVCHQREVYLQRYWRHEDRAADQLVRRARVHDRAEAGSEVVEAALLAAFGPPPAAGADADLQREAARTALTGGLTVVAGGPGTGKTRTIARLLVAAHHAAEAVGEPIEVALAAPTGKAAARMTEAIGAEVAELAAHDPGVVPTALRHPDVPVAAGTLHRLLGWAPGTGGHFAHDHERPLPHDLVIVDETSMVSLPLLARLLDAVRPDARLVLVGDPDQLASVEAGTVMSDVVGPARDGAPPFDPPAGAAGGVDAPEAGPDSRRGAVDPGGSTGDADATPLVGRVAVLRRVHRFADDSPIAALADAVRSGDTGRALGLLAAGDDDPDAGVRWVRADDATGRAEVEGGLVAAGVEVVEAARAGDGATALAAASRTKVLAATRRGELGVWGWTDRVEPAVANAAGLRRTSRWYVGRPILVTANDPLARVANGDVGVLVEADGERAVALDGPEGVRLLAPSRLAEVDTWWAMTIHKSQGSELAHPVVSLPDAASPILTRELLYTAITRAKERLTVVADEAALVAALEHPVRRASGLRARLWGASPR